MIDFSGYTKENIESQMLAQVDENIDTREGSLTQTAIAPGAWWLEGMYLLLAQLQQSAFAQTAEGASLDLITSARGIVRKEATPAVKRGEFLNSSGVNMDIPLNSRFKTINGDNSVVYKAIEKISTGVYRLECETAGAIGNNYTGAILPITAINGLATATIGTILTVGADEETDDALRSRYEDSFGQVAFGGNMASYQQGIMAVSGVGAVQVWPNTSNTAGRVECVILGDDMKPADAALISAVQLVVDDEIEPIGAVAHVSTANETAIDVACSISWEAGRGGAADVQAVEDAIEAYLADTIDTWDVPIIGYDVTYAVNIYIARVITAILAVDGVVNVSNVTLNGAATDISLTEAYNNSNIPKLGTVTIS